MWATLGFTSCERENEQPGSTSTPAQMQPQGADPTSRAGDPYVNWPERYEGRPLLILLENYALDVIGELPAGKDEQLVAVTRRVWGGDSDWKATLRRVMAWDGNMDGEIRENWGRFRAAAKDQGMAADPMVFARAFADEIARRPDP